VVLELAVIRAARIHQLRPLDELVGQVKKLGGDGSNRRKAGGTAQRATRATGPSAAPTVAEKPAGKGPTAHGDVWPRALAELEQTKKPLAIMLEKGACTREQSAVESGRARFIIELDSFSIQQAEKNRKLLEQALSKAHGAPCSVELRAGANSSGPAPKKEAEPKGEHIKKTIAMFNGRVVHTENQTDKESSDG